jgi:hypothetical protein
VHQYSDTDGPVAVEGLTPTHIYFYYFTAMVQNLEHFFSGEMVGLCVTEVYDVAILSDEWGYASKFNEGVDREGKVLEQFK